MREITADRGGKVADPRRIVVNLPALRSDTEATARGLRREADTPQEAVFGFFSAI